MADTMPVPSPKIVLVWPEIPGNTGSIGRTCVALGMELILIKPYGFDITEKSVRRAGLDYWQHVRLSEYESWGAFTKDRRPEPENIYLFEEFGQQSVYETHFAAEPWLIFGQETKGIPQFIVDQFPDRLVNLPMRSAHIRSLNLSNAVAAVAYQALRSEFIKG